MDLPEEPIIKTEIQPTNLENTEKIQLQLETKIKNIQDIKEKRKQFLDNDPIIKLQKNVSFF